jgi:Spy/CpxP family protein refolding chaperone
MAQPVRGPGSGAGDGGGAAAQRERLITALELTTEQQARLDAIGAEMRPRFQSMADLSDADRAALRGRLRAEMQQKIRDMLTPAQRQTYERLLAQSLGQGAATPQGAQAAAGAGGVASGLPAARGAPAAARAASSGAQASTPAPSTAAPLAGAGNPSGPVAAPLAGGGVGGGGPLLEFRNRLVAELRLTPDQAAKVDALMADVRPRFMTLRDLAPEERPKARDRIMADLRARIGDVLTAEQKTKYVAMLTEAASRTATRGRIYLLGEDGKPKAYNVRLGITDGSSTELLVAPNGPNAAELKEGAVVVIGVQGPSAPAGNRPPSGPRMAF